ncbi:ComEC/Rec2 family competence protein [Streptomyces mesophilus]|uniref:ComEC/Rec2 family competence protein n=1 Tax=Streptomyces mesophilus TaxID=1775132 RepID=UPI00332DC636
MPPVLAAWAAAALAVGHPLDRIWPAAGGCLLLALALLGWELARRRERQGRRRGFATPPAGAPDPATADSAAPPPAAPARPRIPVLLAAAAALLCAGGAALSAGLHSADLYQGPLPGLAGTYATVTVELTVTSDPRISRPRVDGDRLAPPSIVFDADVRRVTTTDTGTVATRTPVLVIARPAPPSAGSVPSSSSSAPLGASPVRPGASPVPPGTRPAPPSTSPTEPDTRRPTRIGARSPAPGVSPTATDTYRLTLTGEPSPTSQLPTEPDTRRPPPIGEPSPTSQPPTDSAWLSLLPSTRLHLRASLSPPLSGGDRVAAVLRVPGGQEPHIIEGPTALQRTAGDLRAGLREATDRLPADARALLPGLVVGDTTRVPPDLDDAFRATDLTHLLAVSGSNLTIVLVLLIGPPALAMRAERRGLAPRLGLSLRTTAVIGGALTLVFVLVCRPDPSVLRAAACGAIALLAIATGRRRSLIPALAAAALLLLLYDPWLSHSYGFLLSVLATGALLVIAPRWSAALQRRRVPPRIAEALAAAASAQAVCAPVVVVLSSRVSLVAVPCNLLAELAVAPATVLGFAVLVLAPVAMPLAKALAWCAGWPTGWVASVARTGAGLPGAQADWPDGWGGALMLAVLVLVSLPLARRVLRHPLALIACALLLVLAVLRPAPLTRVLTGWPPPDWRYVLCDVGQGDASVLATGPGTAVVIDAGPDPRLVDQCLHTLGVTRVPLVLLTHFHADHVAGLPGVLRGRSVGAIQATGLQQPPEQAEFVRVQAEAHGVPLLAAAAGESRRAGPVRWQVLWPPADHPGATAPTEPNDASVTLLVRTAGLTLLLPGDLEPPAQQALLRAHPDLPAVDVLKVPHHGSAHQDPLFLQRVRPRLAVIGVGRDNGYGHPSPRVIDTLRSFGTTVLRTDRDGAVALAGAGPTLRVAARDAHQDNGP